MKSSLAAIAFTLALGCAITKPQPKKHEPTLGEKVTRIYQACTAIGGKVSGKNEGKASYDVSCRKDSEGKPSIRIFIYGYEKPTVQLYDSVPFGQHDSSYLLFPAPQALILPADTENAQSYYEFLVHGAYLGLESGEVDDLLALTKNSECMQKYKKLILEE